MAAQLTLSGPSTNEKVRRKSYSREYKLEVAKFYRENNLYRTSKFYSLNTKTVIRWAKDEEKLKKAKKGSKHLKHNRRAAHPEVEEKLYLEYKELRKKGEWLVSYYNVSLNFTKV